MDDYANNGLFFKVIALHEVKDINWEAISYKVPLLPRGWYELCRLPKDDRVDFSMRFWLSKLIDPEGHLYDFFNKLEDISIFLTQETKNSPFHAHMIYSFSDDFFFHGEPPASDEAIFHLNKQFESIEFPKNYLSFLQIHDGFSKCHDSGIIKIKELAKTYIKFQELVTQEILLNTESTPIDPKMLIPFYESRELHSYQCFYSEWVKDHEMGNVSYDPEVMQEVSYLLEEGHAHPTFLSWLLSYLSGENDV